MSTKIENSSGLDSELERSRSLEKRRELCTAILDAVAGKVDEAIAGMELDVLYETEYFCDPEIWGRWGASERDIAGAALRFLIDYEGLPLELATAEREFPQLIRLMR